MNLERKEFLEEAMVTLSLWNGNNKAKYDFEDFVDFCQKSYTHVAKELAWIALSLIKDRSYSETRAIIVRILGKMSANDSYMNIINTLELDYRLDSDEWMKEFDPILDQTGEQEMRLCTSEGDIVLELSIKMSEMSGYEAQNHVWTRVEGDSGEDVLVSGYATVNRMEYMVCRVPHSIGESVNPRIEVRYYD